MKRIVVLIAVSGSLAFASSGHAANQATELGDHKKALSELEKLGGSVASSKSPIRPALMPVPPRSAPSGVSSVQGSFLVQGSDRAGRRTARRSSSAGAETIMEY